MTVLRILQKNLMDSYGAKLLTKFTFVQEGSYDNILMF